MHCLGPRACRRPKTDLHDLAPAYAFHHPLLSIQPYRLTPPSSLDVYLGQKSFTPSLMLAAGAESSSSLI